MPSNNSPEYSNLFQFCSIKIDDEVECRPFVMGEMGFNTHDCFYNKPFTGKVTRIDWWNACYLVRPRYGKSAENIAVPFFAITLISPKMDLESAKNAFISFHNASGFKVGDKVKITRKANTYEMGWSGCWDSAMDACINKIGEIVGDINNHGWRVKFTDVNMWDLPDFILQKVEDAPMRSQ